MRVESNVERGSARVLILFLAAAATAAALTASGLSGCASESDAKPITHDAIVARGEYLATIGGCNDCHTPWKMGEHGPEQDFSRRLSGHPASFPITAAPALDAHPWMWAGDASGTAFAGPWGVSFAANLTPDPATGLVMEEPMFKQALRTGKHMGAGREILPPMPWFNYGKMTDDDLHALYSYLRTLPPVENEVPAPIPPNGPAMGAKM